MILNEKLLIFPESLLETQEQQEGPTAAKPIEIEVSSLFPELLEPTVEKLIQELRAIEGLSNITDTQTCSWD